MAPSAELVPSLVKELFAWLKNSKDVHPLIKSSDFHYEFEFIHPFADGNGRMGRMWQTLLLHNWNSVFGWLPVETLIKERQQEYYRVLGECDYEANSTKFIEFILRALYDTLIEVSKTDQVTDQETDQVKKLMHVIGDEVLSAAELMNRLGIKHKPTFRDNYLKPAMEKRIIEMTVKDKPNSSKQKYRKVR